MRNLLDNLAVFLGLKHPWETHFWSDSEYRKREGLPQNNTYYEYSAGAGKLGEYTRGDYDANT